MYKEYCCRPTGVDRRRQRWSLLREFVESRQCVVALLNYFFFISFLICFFFPFSPFRSSRKFLHIFSFEIHPAKDLRLVCAWVLYIVIWVKSVNRVRCKSVCVLNFWLVCISIGSVAARIMQALLSHSAVTFICIRSISVAIVVAIGTCGTFGARVRIKKWTENPLKAIWEMTRVVFSLF